MASTAAAPESSLPDEDEHVPDWVLAKRGIRMLINNNAREAEALFLKYPDSLPMFAGYSFATFMDALMSFEDDKLNLATSVLKEVERKCTAEHSWLKSMKSKMFGSNSDMGHSLAENLETQIILADSQVCLAILIFLQQDISGYFKGGWVLRKSWKIYQSTYNEIMHLYKDIVGDVPLPEVSDTSHTSSSLESLDSAATSRKDSSDWSCQPPLSEPSQTNGYYNLQQQQQQQKQQHLHHHSSKQKIPYSQSAFLTQLSNSKQSDNNDNTSSGNSSPNSMKNNCSTTNSINNFSLLKKSISVNSALSKHLHKSNNNWTPFSSSLSLAYFTSTFHLFSNSTTTTTTATSNEKLKSRSVKSVNRKRPDIDHDTIQRLMGAVSFGYGLFQLGISLLPPSLLKLTNFLGFGGNRQNGIECLMYSRLGVDMRAPLATLSLLWYHTIVRPFYALDGSNVQAGVDAASQLLNESDEEYGQSSLFLFFKGRVNRLNSDIPRALDSFQTSVENATQREIKILALHEVGWCHLIQLDYNSAKNTFMYLKSWSRWSKGFYSYLGAICSGSCDNVDNLINIKEVKLNIQNSPKANQLDEFLTRRSKLCPESETELATLTCIYWKLLVYEMLYLWNAMPSCTHNSIANIKSDCASLDDSDGNEPMLGLSKLILGVCCCILRDYQEAVKCFRKCLDLRKNLPTNAEDGHVSAFAQYELGSLLVKVPETKNEGKLLLQQMGHYKDYDFEHRLNVRVHSMLKHL